MAYLRSYRCSFSSPPATSAIRRRHGWDAARDAKRHAGCLYGAAQQRAVNVGDHPPVQVTVQTGDGGYATTVDGHHNGGHSPWDGNRGAVLTGATQSNAIIGVATFTNLRVDRAGTGYALTATSPNLTSAGSNGFTSPHRGTLRTASFLALPECVLARR